MKRAGLVSKENTLGLAASQIDHSQCYQTAVNDEAKQFLEIEGKVRKTAT
jgi:hypothetical protein